MQKLLSPACRQGMVLFLSGLLLVYTFSCSYFTVTKGGQELLTDLIQVEKMQKTYIIHFSFNEKFVLLYPDVKESRLTGTLLEASPQNVHYYKGRPEQYKPPREKSILQEVHIYLEENQALPPSDELNIPLTQIREIHVIDLDTGRTTLSYFLGTLGVIAGAAIVGAIIIALTKSSCPYVYAHDGEGFAFVGEIYGGAVLQNLERDDYLPLPKLQTVDQTYQVRITNELKERQFTNVANLIIVEHDEKDRVLLDRRGFPQRITAPQPPRLAVSAGGASIISELSATDDTKFLFNETDQKRNSLELTFQKPPYTTQGKLILTAKNTLWFDYLFGEFTKKFGNFYDDWIDKQRQATTTERLQKIEEQEFPLTIFLQTPEGWQVVDRLPTIGPMADRELVIPVDLSAVNGEEVTLRMETGFLFWEVDYAAMDFSQNENLSLTEITPSLATGNAGKNYTSILSEDDDRYLAQHHIGDVAEIHYQAVAPQEGRRQSFFLHAKGYYEHIRDYEGAPDLESLNQFREPGHFSKFSKTEYLRILRQEEALARAY